VSLNVVMMATGEFALPGFRAVVESDHRVSALITQPDRVNPRGKPHAHPLKEFALEQNIPVFQPDSINTPDSIRKLQSLRPDVVLVAAYGQILKADVINVPRLGMYNLHASLLPRHRGAAPIQYAIWKGDEVSGVTVFQIVPKLDAGPMIVKIESSIGPRETSRELHDRLAIVGADAFLETLKLLESATAQPLVQDDSLATKSPKISKAEGEIDWSKTSREIDCHIRAMQPWPNPYTFLHRENNSPERVVINEVMSDPSLKATSPGKIIINSDNRLLVSTGDGVVEVKTLQPAGKKMMSSEEFLRGRPLSSGDWFGSES